MPIELSRKTKRSVFLLSTLPRTHRSRFRINIFKSTWPWGLRPKVACAYAMVENIDDNMGRVLAKLEQLKIADDTVFIF